MGSNDVHGHRLLQLEHQPCTDRLDDGRGAALFALGRVVEVAVLTGVDVGNGAAAGDVGNPVAHQLTPHDQDTRGAGTADQLVETEEDGVLVGQRVAPGCVVHLDIDVWRRRGEVPAGE